MEQHKLIKKMEKEYNSLLKENEELKHENGKFLTEVSINKRRINLIKNYLLHIINNEKNYKDFIKTYMYFTNNYNALYPDKEKFKEYRQRLNNNDIYNLCLLLFRDD